MSKYFFSFVICLSIFFSLSSYALDLGEIESSSHLNQPFRAKIDVIATQVEDISELKIRVASPEIFERVGIPWSNYLKTLRFISTIENGKPIIRISSNELTDEPLLNFLMEVSWSKGQLLKEYSFELAPAFLVKKERAMMSDRTAFELPQESIAEEEDKTNHQYLVIKGDTLSIVATKLLPSGVDHQQMMWAIFSLNPVAFQKGNIDYLKAGSVLHTPSSEEVSQINHQKNQLAHLVLPKKSLTNLVSNLSLPEKSREESKVVKPLPLIVDVKNFSPVLNQLEFELNQMNTFVASKLKKNINLASRVSELESLLRKNNRLILLKNEELATERQAKLARTETQGITNKETYPLERWVDLVENTKTNKIQEIVLVDEKEIEPDFSKNTTIGLEKAAAESPQSALFTSPEAVQNENYRFNEELRFGLFGRTFLLKIGGVFILVLLLAWLIIRREKEDEDDKEDEVKKHHKTESILDINLKKKDESAELRRAEKNSTETFKRYANPLKRKKQHKVAPNKSTLSGLNVELTNGRGFNQLLSQESSYFSEKHTTKKSDSFLGDLDDDLSFMNFGDDDFKQTEVSTKLDLVRTYLDRGVTEGAFALSEEEEFVVTIKIARK